MCRTDKWKIFNQDGKIIVNACQLYTLCYFEVVYANISSLLFPWISSSSFISAIHPAWGWIPGHQARLASSDDGSFTISNGGEARLLLIRCPHWMSRTQGLLLQPPWQSEIHTCPEMFFKALQMIPTYSHVWDLLPSTAKPQAPDHLFLHSFGDTSIYHTPFLLGPEETNMLFTLCFSWHWRFCT